MFSVVSPHVFFSILMSFSSPFSPLFLIFGTEFVKPGKISHF